MAEHGSPLDNRPPRRCAWCNTPDQGWSAVHLLISETGLAFCSRTCVEAMENEIEAYILIVAEGGTHAPETFGEPGVYERLSSHVAETAAELMVAGFGGKFAGT